MTGKATRQLRPCVNHVKRGLRFYNFALCVSWLTALISPCFVSMVVSNICVCIVGTAALQIKEVNEEVEISWGVLHLDSHLQLTPSFIQVYSHNRTTRDRTYHN